MPTADVPSGGGVRRGGGGGSIELEIQIAEGSERLAAEEGWSRSHACLRCGVGRCRYRWQFIPGSRIRSAPGLSVRFGAATTPPPLPSPGAPWPFAATPPVAVSCGSPVAQLLPPRSSAAPSSPRCAPPRRRRVPPPPPLLPSPPAGTIFLNLLHD